MQKNAFKLANNIFIPSTAQLPYCIIYFVPSLPMPGKTDTDFEDAFLAFRKGMLLLIITNFCIIYLFLHALIFYQPVWTPKTTFQTVENNFPDRASFFRQLTFFTLYRIYFTLQVWMGKCQFRALYLYCSVLEDKQTNQNGLSEYIFKGLEILFKTLGNRLK